MLIQCRTGVPLQCPSCTGASFEAIGFAWYDVGQRHIVTNATFRNCGSEIDGAGCGVGGLSGCMESSVTTFLSWSEEFVPQMMQVTSGIKYESCGYRFKLPNSDSSTILSRSQASLSSSASSRMTNWFDADGTASGLNEPAIIGSGASDAADWWRIDSACSVDTTVEGATVHLCHASGTRRVGSLRIVSDSELYSRVGDDPLSGDPPGVCKQGTAGYCDPIGWASHWGWMPGVGLGYEMPLTAQGTLTVPTGGFGVHLRFEEGAPALLQLDYLQAVCQLPASHLLH